MISSKKWILSFFIIAFLTGLGCLSHAQTGFYDIAVDIGLKPVKTHENALYGVNKNKCFNFSDRYTFKKGKIWGLIGIGVGSFVWYAKERYEFQGRRFFEVRWGADPYGFWGSKSHIRVRNKWFKDDYYHVSNTGGKYLIIGASVTFGISAAKQNKRFKHYLFDALIIVSTSITCSYIGDRVMNLQR